MKKSYTKAASEPSGGCAFLKTGILCAALLLGGALALSACDTGKPVLRTSSGETPSGSVVSLQSSPAVSGETSGSEGVLRIEGTDVVIPCGTKVDLLSLVQVYDEEDSGCMLSEDHAGADLSLPGVYPVVYTASDSLGRSATLTINVTIADVVPPQLQGEDFSVEVGSSVSYKSKVTVTDDYDDAPVLEIDASDVDLDVPGRYSVRYTASDRAGNVSNLTLTVTVTKKLTPEEEELQRKEQFVHEECRRILDQILTPDMIPLQKAYSIYLYTRKNVSYVGKSDTSSEIVGAYDGLTKKSGDCYTYFSVAKALLTEAGIETRNVVKERTDPKQSHHYWLLVSVGEGWYHFDSTPYKWPEDDFFMLTDAELHGWDDKYYKYCHNYLRGDLPEVSTVSIQDRIDYSSSRLKY